MSSVIPVILFAYNRPRHLQKTLDSLRINRVPLIYAFSDGSRVSAEKVAVTEVRRILRASRWCDLVLCERTSNFGLGRSILAGVTEVLQKHEAAIICEDDLRCVPNTYDYLCAGLQYYRDDQRVMSVTGFTHPIITPGNVTDQPYFDCRAESWLWGTWRRAWEGMETDAQTLMDRCEAQGIDIYRCGADMVEMAKVELRWNIWAVRFLYSHLLKGGLCLRPPWSMVEQLGFDTKGTNAISAGKWVAGPMKPCPPIPMLWPVPTENGECALLHQNTFGKRPRLFKVPYLFVRRVAPRPLWRILQRLKASALDRCYPRAPGRRG